MASPNPPGWKREVLEFDSDSETSRRRQEAEGKKPQRKTKGAERRTEEGDDSGSSQGRYNLRRLKRSPNYKEREKDDDDDDDDDYEEGSEGEDGTPARQNVNTSHRSPSSNSDNSYLSTTDSDSFSYTRGPSPVGGVQRQVAYPDLSLYGAASPQNRSPQQHRRGGYGRPGLHSDKEPARPENSSRRDPSKLQPESVQPKEQLAGDSSFSKIPNQCWLIVLCAFVVVVALVGVSVIGRGDQDAPVGSSEQMVSDFERFSRGIEEVKKRFPGQTERFWKVVRSCTRHVFDPDLATYPAVLLMVGGKEQAALASHLAQAVQQEFESVRLHRPSQPHALNLTAAVQALDADRQKLTLDEWLKERLDSGGAAAVVVSHLESLLPEAALLLHAYCDGDNAPYKDALLIWTLSLDPAVDSPRAAEDALRDLWTTEFMRDKVGALLSRVANNIALITAPGHETE